MEKCCIPNCDNVARYFMPIFKAGSGVDVDPAASKPYYYCQECRDEYPKTYTWLIEFEPFDWEAETLLMTLF